MSRALAQTADDEARRIETLRSYAILDTPHEEEFDDLVALAAQICGTPIALITLIDERRQWYKAAFGLDIKETSREFSFCAHAFHQSGVFVVPDATLDQQFAGNPFVVGDPAIRFYAGAPLNAPDGQTLGALCVIDREPRTLTKAQEHALSVLSRLVMAKFELRRETWEKSRVNRALLSLLEDERRAQAAVRESEELNRAVLNSMLAHIAVIDREGRVIAVNDAWLRFASESVGDNSKLLARTDVGMNYLDVCRGSRGVLDKEATMAYEGLLALLRGERSSFTLEYPCNTRDGKRWFLLSATPLKTEGGGAAVAHLDITERKASEEMLRLSNHRFEILARATNDAVRDWDLATNAVWWNEGFETLFGFRRDEIESNIESWSGRIHPDDRAGVEAGVRQAIASGDESWSARYRFKRRDGTYAHVLDRGQLIRDDDGKATRMLAGMTDVTERLLLEEQLRQSHRLEAVGQLTGGVAHDFNNLLTVIMGNAELLYEGLEKDLSRRELAEMIVGAAKSAAELTKRLLAFARKQALNPIAVDSNQLIAGMYPLLRRALGADMDIELIPGVDLWQALVDSAQLENALLNLCINARDAMSGGGRLIIETSNVELDRDYAAGQVDVIPGDYVLIAVTDSGCGIAPEVLQRVFEPFFTTKDKGKGTGLGLAMVYGFIKQSGGHISIYSETGHGTAVRMYFPRVANGAAVSSVATGTFRAMRGSETILLVEDDELVGRFAISQLKALGYIVLRARDGVQALEMLELNDKVDILFTDIVMPGGISGRQLADAACRKRPGLKVLFTSGYSEDAIMHQGRLDPGVQLLAKPYRRNELARRIRSVLDSN